MQKLIPVFFLFLTTIFLAACQPAQPLLLTDTPSFDFGDVVNGEVATHDFIIRNEGDAPLIVESIITTCGCTTATLNPMTIQAGEIGVVHVAFDSSAHGPDLTGEIVRQVFITSNDPGKPELVFEISATVLARPRN